ncbi:agouti signaling protein 1 [Pseudochaenichthys georgianus]|uniref:agouti signaling protein 1 n=1 Tax=Pseudochaenichthys georgianus TaxID=52239 RepID=UPI00146C16DF|nr:agouti signaling protein 1 [Pseudochaenichthys georgianus]
MHALLLLSCLVLAATDHFLASAHMIPDESLTTKSVVLFDALSQSLDISPPPVVIVELRETVKRNKKTKKQKKRKKKRPHPPADCVPLGGSCKSSNNVCCDFCAFCQCRLFRTVCFCRMGNPSC